MIFDGEVLGQDIEWKDVIAWAEEKQTVRLSFTVEQTGGGPKRTQTRSPRGDDDKKGQLGKEQKMSSIAKDLKTYKLQLNDGDNLIGVLKDFSMAEEGAVPLSQKLENTTIENLAKVASMAGATSKESFKCGVIAEAIFPTELAQIRKAMEQLTARRLQS